MFENLYMDAPGRTISKSGASIGEDMVIDALPVCLENTQKLARLRRTEQLLIDLAASIREHGLSKSLLAFADRTKALSTAIPVVPAVESFTDTTERKSAEIADALDKVNVFGEEAFKTKSIGAVGWIAIVVGFFLGLFPGIILYIVFKNFAADGSMMVKTVLKYRDLVALTEAALDVNSVFQHFSAAALPTTTSELNSFYLKLGGALDEVAPLAISVRNGEPVVGEFPAASKGTLKSLGYTDGSLSHVAGLVKSAESKYRMIDDTLAALLKLNTEEAEKIAKDPKASDDAKRAARVGASLRAELYQMTLTRSVKALRLVKSTMAELSDAYEEGSN